MELSGGRIAWGLGLGAGVTFGVGVFANFVADKSSAVPLLPCRRISTRRVIRHDH